MQPIKELNKFFIHLWLLKNEKTNQRMQALTYNHDSLLS